MLRSFGRLWANFIFVKKEHDPRTFQKYPFELHYVPCKTFRTSLRSCERNNLKCVRVTRLSTIRSERIMARKRLFAARCSSVTPSISQGARRRVGGICFRARPVISTLMRRVARLTSPLYQQLDVKIVARVSVVERSVNSRSRD